MARLVILGSGRGSNAENLIRFFKGHTQIEVVGIISNIADAGIFQIARDNDLPAEHITAKTWKENPDSPLHLLKSWQADYLILAGYLLLLPPYIIEAYPDKIINIHPALLPSFGGKGMYGMNVHQAVVESGASQSGITIHLVNEEYDKGRILFQAICPIQSDDDAEKVAQKIHKLEYRYFPEVIERYLSERL